MSHALVIVSIVLIDQFSKGVVQSLLPAGSFLPIISHHLELTHAPGHSLIGNGWVMALSLAALGWAFWRLFGNRQKFSGALPYSLVIGGVGSNLIDRLLQGHVLNWIALNRSWALNLADLSIALAALWLVFRLRRERA